MSAARQAALLAAVCLILHHLGPLPEVVEAPAIAAALLVRLASCRPSRGAPGGTVALVLRLIGIPILLALPDPAARLCALLAITLTTGDAAAPREALFTGLVLAARLAAEAAPIAWMATVEMSRLASGLAGTLTGQPLDLGPSASGLYLVALAMLLRLCVSTGSDADRRGALRWLAACATWLGFMAALPWLGDLGGPLSLGGPLNLTHEHLASAPQQRVAAMLGWLPLLLALVCLLLLPAARVVAGAPWRRGLDRRAGAIGACAALALCFLTGLRWSADPMPRATASGDIVLLRGPGADALRPERGRWGLASAGMFGMLPSAMAIEGLRVRSAEGELTESMLRGAAALVMALPAASLDEAQVVVAHQFVRRGGSLVVLADHTDLMGLMEPANRLLEPAGIRVAFDSAFPAVPFWRRCLSGPLASRWGSTGLGTGASLSIHGRARPLLVGRYSLADAGDRANAGPGAGLGNYAWDRGERVGDLVVAAWAPLGKGRLMALGDTSSFQNLPLPMAHRFVASLLGSLARPGAPASRQAGDVAIVDLAHLNDVTEDFWRKDSIGGLLVALQREGRIPIVADSRLRLARLLERHPRALVVIVAPRQPFSRGLAAALRSRLESGADLLVAAGPESARCLGPLLDPLGLAIDTMPLGPVPVRPDPDPVGSPSVGRAGTARNRPQFRRAWPIVIDPAAPARVWYEAFDRPVVAERRPGGAHGGRLMLIADPSFLTDDVLENERSAWEGNVDLLSRLLAGQWVAP